MIFFFQMDTIGVVFKNVLVYPSFIMARMGVEILKPKKVHPSIIKSALHGSGVSKGLLKGIHVFGRKKEQEKKGR